MKWTRFGAFPMADKDCGVNKVSWLPNPFTWMARVSLSCNTAGLATETLICRCMLRNPFHKPREQGRLASPKEKQSVFSCGRCFQSVPVQKPSARVRLLMAYGFHQWNNAVDSCQAGLSYPDACALMKTVPQF